MYLKCNLYTYYAKKYVLGGMIKVRCKRTYFQHVIFCLGLYIIYIYQTYCTHYSIQYNILKLL